MGAETERKPAKFLTNQLSLPLFMASRLRLKQPLARDELKQYIHKKRSLYLSTPNADNAISDGAYTLRKHGHILGTHTFTSRGHCELPYNSSERSSSKDKTWQLPPNRYNLKSKPYENKSGLKGAYWRKIPKTKSRKVTATKPTYRLYDLPREMEKMDGKCHRHKGLLLSNARAKRPTTRCMISNPLTAYKDPNEPGPSSYTPTAPKKSYEIAKPPQPASPHVFYRKSIVPVKKNSIHPQHISFRPGPGRYETRYRNICPCSRNLKYQPELDVILEREKRLKFRRLPYMRIKSHLYCSPDWRHVKGGGFKRLFRGGKPQTATVTATDEAKNKTKELKLYHDAKYFNMITHTPYDPGTFRKEPMPELPIRITYNRMIRVISRKQLRSNRKIAFSSRVERWKDEDRPAALTPQQLREVREKLPLERRIRNLPVMTKRKGEIASKLLETPQHMLANYVPKLRKRLFKFLPLPEAKILISESDIRPVKPANHGYFFRPLDEKLFFKDI